MKKKGWGCWLWGIGFIVGCPLLLVVIGVLLFVGRERSARAKLNSRIEELAAKGMPVDDETLLEFNKKLTSSEDTRAWMAVFKQTDSAEFRQSGKGVPLFDSQVTTNIPAPGEKWPEPKTKAPAPETATTEESEFESQVSESFAEDEIVIVESDVRDFLSNWSELHDKVLSLSLKQLQPDAKGVQFISKFDSLNTLLPCAQSLRDAARLLNLRGQIALYDRDSKQVKTQIEAMLGCSRTLRSEPILVSQLVLIAIDGMALELLKSGLEYDVLDEEELIALLPLFSADVDIGPQWRLALQGERAMALPVFENPALAGSEVARIPARSRDALYFLDAMDRVLAIPDDDFDAFMAGLKAEDEQTNKLMAGSILTKVDSILTSLLTPAYGAVGSAIIRRAVQHRMAVACIGIRLYEKRNGKWPATLDDLQSLQVDGAPFDPAKLLPAGGQPFGYRFDEREVTVWGGNPRLDPATPPEPLSTAEGEVNAEENKLWIWKMRAVSK